MIPRISRLLISPKVFAPQIKFTFSEKLTQKSFEEIKASQELTKCIGLNRFMTRVYNTTGLSILGALSTSYAVMNIPILTAAMMPLCFGGIIGTFVGFLGAQYMKPIDASHVENGITIHKTSNSPLRLGLYALGTMSLGLSAAPLFFSAAAISPSILPSAIGITSAIFGGSSLMAYNMPKGKMLSYGPALFGSLLGLIGMNLVGILGTLFFGPNPISMMLFRADNYIGIALFTAFIAYDTHVALKMYEQKMADHLGMSIQFLLDFWNILVRLVSIMSRRD